MGKVCYQSHVCLCDNHMGLYQQQHDQIKCLTQHFDIWLLTAVSLIPFCPLCSTRGQTDEKMQFFPLAPVGVSNHASPCQNAEIPSLSHHKAPSSSSFPALSSHFGASLGGHISSPQKTSFLLCVTSAVLTSKQTSSGVCSDLVECLHHLKICMRWNMNKVPEVWHVLMFGWF